MSRGESRKFFAEGTDGIKPNPFAWEGWGGAGKSRTLADMPDNWREVILSHMSLGASELEIKALLSIGNDTHARWMRAPDDGGQDEFAEYREIFIEGRILSQAWWERIGRLNVGNKNFNSTLWMMNMTNRFRGQWKRSEDSTLPPDGDTPKEKETFELGGRTFGF